MTSGACRAPANRASSSSRDGRSARAVMSAAVSTLVPRAPPLSTSSGLVRAVSRSALAAATESSPTNVSAVGPTSSSFSPSSPALSAANRARVFLYTLCSAPLSRSAPRSVARAPTFIPRYSVTKTALASLSFDAISSTMATFSERGFVHLDAHLLSHVSRGDSLWQRAPRRDLRGACTSVGGVGPHYPPGGWTNGLRRATVWFGRPSMLQAVGRDFSRAARRPARGPRRGARACASARGSSSTGAGRPAGRSRRAWRTAARRWRPGRRSGRPRPPRHRR